MPDEGKNQIPRLIGEGEYFRIRLEEADEFTVFITHNVDKNGWLKKTTGQTKDGRWITQKWLVHKSLAHRSGDELIADRSDIVELFSSFKGKVKHYRGDIYKISLNDEGD